MGTALRVHLSGYGYTLDTTLIESAPLCASLPLPLGPLAIDLWVLWVLGVLLVFWGGLRSAACMVVRGWYRISIRMRILNRERYGAACMVWRELRDQFKDQEKHRHSTGHKDTSTLDLPGRGFVVCPDVPVQFILHCQFPNSQFPIPNTQFPIPLVTRSLPPSLPSTLAHSFIPRPSLRLSTRSIN